MIRDGELARMQAQAQTALPAVCLIWRVSESSDGQGGRTQSRAIHATVAARVDDAGNNPAVALLAQRIGNRQAFIVVMPVGADVQNGDELEIGGEVYQVLALMSGQNWEIERRAVTVKL